MLQAYQSNAQYRTTPPAQTNVPTLLHYYNVLLYLSKCKCGLSCRSFVCCNMVYVRAHQLGLLHCLAWYIADCTLVPLQAILLNFTHWINITYFLGIMYISQGQLFDTIAFLMCVYIVL